MDKKAKDTIIKADFRSPPDGVETEDSKAIRQIADAVHRTNEAIRRAVDSGLSVELVRVSRYHEGRGHWGDQMIPVIRETGPTQK